MGLLEDFRLKVFVTVAQTGSFTKAAEILGVSQPAVSQNISELEKCLDRKLFQRLRNENVLTPEGEVFLGHARRILSAAAETEYMFAPSQPATVRISASDEIYTYYIAPAVATITALHPGIIFERIESDECDLRMYIRPTTGTPYDIDADVVAKLRISAWPAPKNMGDISATHETVSYFDILFKPSQAFAQTKTCGLIRTYFASLL